MRGQKRVKDAHERPFDPRIHLLGKQVPCQATLKKSLGRVLINPAQCPLRSESDRIAASPRNVAMGHYSISDLADGYIG
jgi:hypothetical protein